MVGCLVEYIRGECLAGGLLYLDWCSFLKTYCYSALVEYTTGGAMLSDCTWFMQR